jgi:predicted Zn-dependent protease
VSNLNSVEDILSALKKHPKLIFADDFEIAVQYENSQKRVFVEGNATDRENFEGFWISVRLLHRKRPGSAVTSDVSAQGLRLVVEQALQAADQSSMDPWFRFALWKPQPAMSAVVENGQYDSLAAHVSTLPLGLRERYYTRSVQTVLARKSEKFELRTVQAAHMAALSMLSTTGSGGAKLEDDWANGKDVSDRGARLEALSAQAALHATLDKRIVSFSDAKDIVLSPSVARDWLLGVGENFRADFTLRGRTIWDTETPVSVSPLFTLVEDPKAVGVPYAANIDLEGMPVQKTPLIEQGERRGLLFDSYTSARENRISTGNFYRIDGEMQGGIHPWHLAVEPGTQERPWKESNYVAYLDQVRIPNGQLDIRVWDRIVSGLLLRRGEPVARIRPFRVRWPVLEMLQGIAGVDKSLRSFGNVTCPCIWWDKMPKDTKEAL